MNTHDRSAIHELINRWWFNYDEGYLDVLDELLTDDCHTSSRTELGNHPHEEFIALGQPRSRCRDGVEEGASQAQPVPAAPPRRERARHRPSAATRSMSSRTCS